MLSKNQISYNNQYPWPITFIAFTLSFIGILFIFSTLTSRKFLKATINKTIAIIPKMLMYMKILFVHFLHQKATNGNVKVIQINAPILPPTIRNVFNITRSPGRRVKFGNIEVIAVCIPV